MSQCALSMAKVARSASWNGTTGERWARHAATMNRALGEIGAEVLEAACIARGAAVLDVGCGAGDTTRALLRAVGSRGRVTGVDVSRPLLVQARQRAGRAHLLLADAGSARLPGPFDVVFSRFGMTFFDDPVAAFAHLRASTRPGGRLAFCCWRRLEDNPWARRPVDAVAPHLGRPTSPPPGVPGPFAFARRDTVRAVLHAAAWRSVSIARYDVPTRWTLTPSLPNAVRVLCEVGPIASRLATATPGARRAVLEALGVAIAPHVGSRGLVLGSSSWIVTARA